MAKGHAQRTEYNSLVVRVPPIRHRQAGRVGNQVAGIRASNCADTLEPVFPCLFSTKIRAEGAPPCCAGCGTNYSQQLTILVPNPQQLLRIGWQGSGVPIFFARLARHFSILCGYSVAFPRSAATPQQQQAPCEADAAGSRGRDQAPQGPPAPRGAATGDARLGGACEAAGPRRWGPFRPSCTARRAWSHARFLVSARQCASGRGGTKAQRSSVPWHASLLARCVRQRGKRG